jgi:hypothetical protein
MNERRDVLTNEEVEQLTGRHVPASVKDLPEWKAYVAAGRGDASSRNEAPFTAEEIRQSEKRAREAARNPLEEARQKYLDATQRMAEPKKSGRK